MREPARWRAVRVHAPDDGGERDGIVAALIGAGAPSVHESDGALLTFVVEGTDLDALRAAVRTASSAAELEVAPNTTLAWQPEWAARVGIQRVGALAVAPPWLARDAGAGAILIEPGMAFGTGEHATTRLVLRLMQGVVRTGDFVADVGAGSAVLAIAAARLGAARVAAIEADADAIWNAEENVARNGISGAVMVLHGDAAALLPLIAPVQVVLANITAPVLLRLEPAVAAALGSGAHAVIGGVLEEERAALLSVYAPQRWRLQVEDSEDEWWSAVLVRL